MPTDRERFLDSLTQAGLDFNQQEMKILGKRGNVVECYYVVVYDWVYPQVNLWFHRNTGDMLKITTYATPRTISKETGFNYQISEGWFDEAAHLLPTDRP